LCRIRNTKVGVDLVEAYKPLQHHAFGTCRINELIVYHSQLTSQGSIYTPVGKYPLEG
jgi:2'-5' RNA ligase